MPTGRRCSVTWRLSGIGHVIDEFIDSHSDEA
jgi:hypothetical protein